MLDITSCLEGKFIFAFTKSHIFGITKSRNVWYRVDSIGGVSPIGHINKVDIFIDNSLERFISLFAAAGHPNCIFEINFKNLQIITNGLIREITE